MSNEKITPGKIIDWFGDEEPLSGYGKMILGESYILTGQIEQGKKLIKEGWITADLSKTELSFSEKNLRIILMQKITFKEQIILLGKISTGI